MRILIIGLISYDFFSKSHYDRIALVVQYLCVYQETPEKSKEPFERRVGFETADGLILKALPNEDAKSVYNPLVMRYRKLENDLMHQAAK